MDARGRDRLVKRATEFVAPLIRSAFYSEMPAHDV